MRSEIEPVGIRDRMNLVVLLVAIALLSWRLFALVDLHSVDLLVADQWDFYGAMMEPWTGWELFRWQHPPHRQGIGMLLIAALAEWSGWNLRVVSFAIAAILVAACLVAAALKRVLFGRWHATDMAIPLIVLSSSQWSTLVGVVNPSHSAIPLLLVLLAGLIWVAVPEPGRVVALAMLMFVAAHTGFAVLLVPVLGAMYAIRLRPNGRSGRERAWDGVGMAASAASLIIFAAGLRFGAAADCFEPFGLDLFFIPTFAFIMFARFAGASFAQLGLLASVVGIILVALAVAALIGAVRRQWRGESDRVSEVIALLLGFSLLFAASAGYGRACISAISGEQSRYMTLVAPAFIALYFASLRSERRWLAFLVVFAVALGSFPLALGTSHPAAMRSAGASAWRDCYRTTRDLERCSAETKFSPHPKPEDTRLQDKLDWLEERRLSLFREAQK